jgi:aldehyde:ferredoxin oxidoreductase
MITLQRLLNAAHGLDATDDMGPELEIDTESADELGAMLSRYYDEHGWDELGVPTAYGLKQLGLTSATDRALLQTAQDHEKAPMPAAT